MVRDGGKRSFGREDSLHLIQLINVMKELADKIDEYYRRGDLEKLNSAKRELLEIQRKAGEIL